MNTSPLSAENLIEIDSAISEKWPCKVKSRGRVYSSRHVYSAKYGTPKSNQFIRDHQCIIPRSFIQIGKDVLAVSCTNNGFWLVTFWAPVTLKIRLHGLKSGHFLRNALGLSPPSFIKIGLVVLAQLSTEDSWLTDRQTDGLTDRRTDSTKAICLNRGDI